MTEFRSTGRVLRDAKQREAFLLRLSDALRSLGDPSAIQSAAAKLLCQALRLDRVGYGAVDTAGEVMSVESDWSVRRLAPWAGERRLLETFGRGLIDALRSGETIIVNDCRSDARIIEGSCADAWASVGTQALLAVPLTKDSRLCAILYLQSAQPRMWTAREIALAEEVAERTWAVVERARAEAALRESEELHRLILESARDYAIFVIDECGVIRTWPAGAEAVFGWSAAEAVGANAAITFTPEDRADGAPAQELAEARENGCAPDVRWHIRKDGSRVFIDGSTRALRDSMGKLIGFFKIGQDVTAQREAERAVRASEEGLRSALKVGQLATWDWDLCTGETVWSDEYYRMHGYDVGEVTPSYGAWISRVHPADRKETERRLREARTRGQEYANEYRALHPDGSVRWLTARGRFFYDEGGAPTRMVGAMSDVTERREWEERQKILVAELQHRTRNLLAVVRSIANDTMAETSAPILFRERLSARLTALSRVQSLLSRAAGEPITIGALVRMELEALGADDAPGTVAVSGPDVPLRSSLVQTLALAVHELATNARKYGALATAEGRLRVAWSTTDQGQDSPRLAFEWMETGIDGRGVADGRARMGYGRELIEHALPYTLHAQTSFELSEHQLRCTIVLPLGRREEQEAA
ncbi:PAS domain S-box protein [Roseomonas hellenica]|uniref:histidine kinase n=1 Tax=Plastoroseomonas hellenica TaxID=2687306 RepID=A0ABS5EVZ3_9PROT|nr:PAS domain S-box protein [Plastoroseomonas hellenica]